MKVCSKNMELRRNHDGVSVEVTFRVQILRGNFMADRAI